MTRSHVCAAALATIAGVALAATSLTAQQKAKNVRDGVFTVDQALRGKSGYDGVCARCHGVPLTGSEGNGPTLKGPAFLAHWDKDTLGSLYTKIRDTMPAGSPGTLTDEVKLQILAYVLQQNGFPAGASDLPGDVNALEEIAIQQRGVWDGIFTIAQADLGIAIGAGTDVAVETGDVVLMKSDPADVLAAIRLSRATVRKMKQNLFWAAIYNVVAIPIAAGVLYPSFGLMLQPEFGALAMSASSISFTNSLKVVLGFQPSWFLALVASPIKTLTSAGRR